MPGYYTHTGRLLQYGRVAASDPPMHNWNPGATLAGMLVVLIAAAVLAAACSGGAGRDTPAAPTGQSNANQAAGSQDAPVSTTPTAQPSNTPGDTLPDTPAAAVDAAVDATVYLLPDTAPQGSAVLLAVDAPDAVAVSVAYGGLFLSLLREGDRFFTVLPVDARAEPGATPLVLAISGGPGRALLRVETSMIVEGVDWPVEAVELDDTTSRLLDPAVAQEDRALRGRIQQSKTPERLWRGFFSLPVQGGITSTFGVRRSYNGAPPSEFHTGLDFAGALGDPVVAPNTGVVAWTGETERRGLGVILDHGGGVFTSYWHLSALDIVDGARVTRGQQLGRLGNSGLSTGPHLHWEVTVHGTALDPLPWLRELEIPDPAATIDADSAVTVVAERSSRASGG